MVNNVKTNLCLTGFNRILGLDICNIAAKYQMVSCSHWQILFLLDGSLELVNRNGSLVLEEFVSSSYENIKWELQSPLITTVVQERGNHKVNGVKVFLSPFVLSFLVGLWVFFGENLELSWSVMSLIFDILFQNTVFSSSISFANFAHLLTNRL